MTSVLITGARGQLGSDLRRGRRRRAAFRRRRFGSKELDITDPDAVEAALTAFAPVGRPRTTSPAGRW